MKKFTKVICVLLLLSVSFLKAEESGNEVSPFVLITMPKSGSHLAIKALHLLTGAPSIWHTRYMSHHYIAREDGFLYTHFCLSPHLEEAYRELPKLKKIINIRDLRDVCISVIHQIHKSAWPGLTGAQREYFNNLPFDDQLLFVINYDYNVNEVAHLAPNSLQVAMLKVARQAIKYCNDPNNLICKYENLVGAEGGGTQEAQLEELKMMAHALQIQMTDDQLEQVAAKLYGDSYNPFGKEEFGNFKSTFHQGKIGLWRILFNEEHKRAFKKKLGKELIALGYEKDDNW